MQLEALVPPSHFFRLILHIIPTQLFAKANMIHDPLHKFCFRIFVSRKKRVHIFAFLLRVLAITDIMTQGCKLDQLQVDLPFQILLIRQMQSLLKDR